MRRSRYSREDKEEEDEKVRWEGVDIVEKIKKRRMKR